jgi:hypothetical protein
MRNIYLCKFKWVNMYVLICKQQIYKSVPPSSTSVYRVGRFSPKIEPAKWANPSYVTMSYELSWELRELCPQRLMSRVSFRTSILPSLARSKRGRQKDWFVCTAMEKVYTMNELAGVAQLRFFGNSSYWYAINVHKILPPEGVNILVDSCCLSVACAHL